MESTESAVVGDNYRLKREGGTQIENPTKNKNEEEKRKIDQPPLFVLHNIGSCRERSLYCTTFALQIVKTIA